MAKLRKIIYCPEFGISGSFFGVFYVYSAVFWLLLPLGQSSTEFLLAHSGECSDVGHCVVGFNLVPFGVLVRKG